MTSFSLPGCSIKPFPICFGTGPIGSAIPRAESFVLLDAYLECGGNFLDTARIYADWLPGERSASEKTIGRWMRERGHRDRLVLATKGAHPHLGGYVPRLARADIGFDLDESLKNLGTDTIDLYWLHRDDVNRPVEDILETLEDQRKAGKIRAYGCSNWTLPRIRAAQDYAASHGLPGFAGNQMRWSLAVPAPDAGGDPTLVGMDEATRLYHRQTRLAAMPYSSQAGGWFQKRAEFAAGRRAERPGGAYATEASERRFERLLKLAAESGLTLTQLTLGWLLAQPFPTFPIIGARTVAQLRDSLRAASVRLTPEQARELEG